VFLFISFSRLSVFVCLFLYIHVYITLSLSVSLLAKACKSVPLNTEEVEQACRELNANVPCPGITPSSDLILVKGSLSGVLRSLNSALVASYAAEHVDVSRYTLCIYPPLYTVYLNLLYTILCI
jgi:hypothetical protein